MYKAIALDLDGTTLHSDSRMSDRLVQLFHRMRAHGIKIFFVSGRTKLEMEDVIPDGLEVDGLVTANGMVSYVDDRMVSKVTLDPDLVKMSVTKAKKEGIYYEIHPLERRRYALIEDRDAMEKELSREKPDTLPDFELLNRKESLKSGLNWKKELTVEDIIKVYFFSMDTNMIRVFRTKLENLKNNYCFDLSASSIHSTEIVAPDVSKATGVRELLDYYQIPSEKLLAVGDAENDLPMFRIAGHAAAMKNAEEDIKKHADEVTRFTNDEDGLYLFLKEKFKEL